MITSIGFRVLCVGMLCIGLVGCGEDTGDDTSLESAEQGAGESNQTSASNETTNSQSNGSGSPDSCECGWEGPVLFSLQQAWKDEDTVYLEAHLEWRPCCVQPTDATRTWRVHSDTTTEIVASVPDTAVTVELPEPKDEWVVIGINSGQQIMIQQQLSRSVSLEVLSVGQLIEADDPETVLATIDVDVAENR